MPLPYLPHPSFLIAIIASACADLALAANSVPLERAWCEAAAPATREPDLPCRILAHVKRRMFRHPVFVIYCGMYASNMNGGSDARQVPKLRSSELG